MRSTSRALALSITSLSVATACATGQPVRSSTGGAGGATSTGGSGTSTSGGTAGMGGGSSATGGGGTGGAGTGGAGGGGATTSSSSSASSASTAASSASSASSASTAASSTGGCAPQCAGKQCGPDGCGGTCGSCSASDACTTGGTCVASPPGPAALRFDVATTQCSASYAGCTIGGKTYAHCCPTTVPGDPTNKCLCDAELDHLNGSPSHFLAVGTEQHKGDLWAAGNFQAVYVDTLNDMYPGSTGAAKADAVIAAATTSFASGVPKWFIVNEISTSLWPSDPTYRQYVRSFAAQMAQSYNKSVVVASPFPAPAANATDWTALAGNAYVAVEVQLTGKDVNGSGNSVSFCKAQFQASATAYAGVGVAIGRLMLVDSYADSAATTAFGRQGVSAAGWTNAINARAQGAHQVGFAGYVSYAWANNEMGDTAATRTGFEDTYLANTVP